MRKFTEIIKENIAKDKANESAANHSNLIDSMKNNGVFISWASNIAKYIKESNIVVDKDEAEDIIILCEEQLIKAFFENFSSILKNEYSPLKNMSSEKLSFREFNEYVKDYVGNPNEYNIDTDSEYYETLVLALRNPHKAYEEYEKLFQ